MRMKIGEWLRVQLPQVYFPFNEYTWAWKRKYIFQLQLFNLVVKALLDFKSFPQGWIEYEEEVRRFCWSSWLRRHFGTGGRQRMKLDPLLTICGTHQTGRLFLSFSHFCIFQIKGGRLLAVTPNILASTIHWVLILFCSTNNLKLLMWLV